MKALTVRQPWAHAIIFGAKRIENRWRATTHRGKLLIHAGSSRVELEGVAEGEWEDHWSSLGMPGLPRPDRIVFGALLGTVEVVDCLPIRECASRPFASGPWCWILENPVALAKPIPLRGQQGLFEVPDGFVKNPAGYLLRGLN